MAKRYKLVITHSLVHPAKYNYSAVALSHPGIVFCLLPQKCFVTTAWFGIYVCACSSLVRTIFCWMCALSLASDSSRHVQLLCVLLLVSLFVTQFHEIITCQQLFICVMDTSFIAECYIVNGICAGICPVCLH